VRGLHVHNGLPALEHRRALLDEGLGGFGVVGRLRRAGVVEGLGLEGKLQVAAFGSVEVLLHQPERDGGAGCEALRQGHRFLGQLRRVNSAVHDAKALGVFCEDHVGKQIQLLRLRHADQLRQEIGAAEVAGEADLCKCGRDLRAFGCNAEIAGEGDGQARAGGGSGNGGDGDLRHVVQPARDFHALAQRVCGLLGRAAMVRAAFIRRKALHISACAERAAGAGDLTALRASGRFRVMIATLPRTSYSTIFAIGQD